MSWNEITTVVEMHAKSKLSVGLSVAAIFLIAYVPYCHGADLRNRLDAITNPLIIQGKDIEVEEAPYQVAIEKLRIQSCGGVIISDVWIVTAAHCVHPNTSGNYGKRIRAGSTTSFPLIGWGGSIHEIQRTDVHPHFDLKLMDYDIAVLKVSNKFVFSSRVQSIQVPEDEKFIDYKVNATVSGYGRTSANAWWESLRLQSAEVPVLTREQCMDLIDKNRLGYFISRRMLCAGSKGSDSSFGDSGGPLVQKGQLIGIVSWSMTPFEVTLPGVYTNVARIDMRTFIHNRTGI